MTTVDAGYGTSGGRPGGTTLDAGSSVGMSGGRPIGTTGAAGYSVGMSTGRPVGTTVDRGYDVGRHAYSTIDFSQCIPPTDWDYIIVSYIEH